MRAWLKAILRRLGLALVVFRLREWWRGLARSRSTPSPDGFPIPPPKLIVLVTGSADTTWYTQGGRLAAESIRGLLDAAGISPCDFQSILDFGCGCGRVIRQWPAVTSATLYGTDCNPNSSHGAAKTCPLQNFSQTP